MTYLFTDSDVAEILAKTEILLQLRQVQDEIYDDDATFEIIQDAVDQLNWHKIMKGRSFHWFN